MKKFLIVISIVLIAIGSCKKEIVEPEPDNLNNPESYSLNKSVGYSANNLLSGADFKHLIIEVIYDEDYKPTNNSANNLTEFLETYLNKPSGISVVWNRVELPEKASYSTSQITDLENQHRKQLPNSDTLTVSFLFLDGDYSGNSGGGKVLGIAYRNTSMAIFQKTVEEFSNGIGEPDRTLLETVVINHEMGHILGLVNTGSDMQVEHQDEAHGHHCDNDNCLMYWTAETGDAIANLVGMSEAPDLDVNCKNDLRANGGK